MDKERIQEVKGLLAQYKQLQESDKQLTLHATDGTTIEVDADTTRAILRSAVIHLENQLEIAKFGKPSENLEDSREFKAARALEDAINSFSFNPDRFAEAIPYMHRTLQQNFFRLVRSCVTKMANAESWRIDPRNEASHKMCKAIAEPMSEYSLPYI